MTNTNIDEVAEGGLVIPSKEKITRLKADLSKFMRLVLKETEGTFHTKILLKLLEVYIIIESAEKGEGNVGRNPSYPE